MKPPRQSIEIEYRGAASGQNPDQITSEMIEFLKKLDCGKVIRNYVGYPFQLLFPDEIREELF